MNKFIRFSRRTAITMGACLWLLAACTTTSSPRQVNVTVDQTFGNYDQQLESDLVLITVSPEQHAALTEIRVTDVTGREGLPPRYVEFLDDMQTRYGLVRVADWPLPAIDIFCIVFSHQSERSRAEVIAQLALEPGIESAQPVQTFEVQQQAYNDPYLPLQHGLRSLDAALSHQWASGRGVQVAVIDTGLDINHPDLSSPEIITKNFVDSDQQQFASDIHGTAVAGVIAAAAGNATGIVGVAPDSTLLALKACWQIAAAGDRAVCNSLTLAKALNFAIANEADIINLSLAGPRDPLLERLIEKALSENQIVVGALPTRSEPGFPTVVPGTIAVALPGTEGASVAAPGEKVLSTHPGNSYDFYTGSSFSTAHIAGLAALVRELSPVLSPDDVLALLNRTADPESGAVNACRAIGELVQTDLDICL